MEPILLSVVGYVAEKFLAQFIKDDIYSRFKEFFWPKPNYRNLLELAIYDTIQQYRKTYPQTPGQLPFFLHKEIFEHLTGYILFKGNSQHILDELYQKNPQIALPSEQELMDFFEIFVTRANRDHKLKKIFLDENYKSEIFSISGHLRDVSIQLAQLIADRELSYNLTIDFYIPRKEEATLMTELVKRGLLLLSGQSFCGKSQLAKMICRDYIQQGYHFLTGDSVETCRQDLLKNKTPTIYLLEDPFSHVFDSNSQSSWRKLEQFLPALPAQHKLIITSRSEVIRQINQDAALRNCLINNNAWIDLTVDDIDFINRYWSELAAYKQLSEIPSDLVSTHLSTNFAQDYLQPGQLMYLANRPAVQLEGKTTAQLCLLAKADSRSIAVEIVEKGAVYQSLYIALGFCCDAIRTVSMKQLSYILSETTTLPGLKEDRVSIRSLTDQSDVIFPKYPELALSINSLEALGILQLRGYIKISGDDVLFSHPTYKDVARYIYSINRPDLNHLLLQLLLKSLACLQTANVMISVGQLEFLFKQRSELAEQLEAIAVRVADDSIFPAVESRITELLVDGINEFPAGTQEKVMRLAQRRTDLSDVFWHDGTPFYNEEGMNIDSIFGRFAEVDTAAFQLLFDGVNEKQYYLTEQVWKFVESYRSKIDDQQLSEAGELWILTYPEAFIRSNFVAIVFAHSWPSEQLIASTLADQHPEVVVEAIKGCFAGYLLYTSEQQEAAKAFIINLLNHPGVIIRASAFFCWFGLSHASESIEWYNMTQEDSTQLWQLWADIFPLFFEKFPDYLEIPNSARFAMNLHNSAKFITPKQGIAIGRQFFQWISHRLERNNDMDSHELGLVSFLMETNPVFSPERAELLKIALDHPHTGFAGVSLAQANWAKDLLATPEVETIISLLTSLRPDSRWLKAIEVSQPDVLPAIQSALFGRPDFLAQGPTYIVANIDGQLLIDALHVYTGSPQPLYWYALHQGATSVWLPVMKYIISSEQEAGFEICLKDMLSHMVNSPGKDWQDGQDIWKELCNNTIQDERLTSMLIAATAASNFSEEDTIELWETLIAVYQKKNRLPTFLAMVVTKVEALQHYDDYDIYKILKQVFNELLVLLPSDRLLILLFQNLEKGDFEHNLIITEVNTILETLKKFPVRLKITFRELKEGLKSKLSNYPELEKLKEITDHIDETQKRIKKDMDDHFELPGWIYPLKKK